MQIPQALALTPRCAEPTLPGTWKLAPGRAITLEPRHAGVLKVAHGRLWVTFEGPHTGRLNESGDQVMGAGHNVRVAPGQRMVVEAWNEGCPTYFSWDPLPVAAPVRRTWGEALQPLSDLRLAFVYGGDAVARLVAGVAQIVSQSLFGPRVSVEERACTKHGAMT
jgi:hypothetical protein